VQCGPEIRLGHVLLVDRNGHGPFGGSKCVGQAGTDLSLQLATALARAIAKVILHAMTVGFQEMRQVGAGGTRHVRLPQALRRTSIHHPRDRCAAGRMHQMREVELTPCAKSCLRGQCLDVEVGGVGGDASDVVVGGSDESLRRGLIQPIRLGIHRVEPLLDCSRRKSVCLFKRSLSQ
jgi:hypothetical protein